MALELDISTQVAHQQIDSLGKKIEELGPIAEKAGTAVKSAFGRQAYRDIQAALASLRREYEKVIAAHTALRKVTNEYLKATAAVAAAVQVQEKSTLSASLATSGLNKVMSQNVGFAKYAQREALILARAQAKAAAAAQAQAAATTQVTAATAAQTRVQKGLLATLYTGMLAHARAAKAATDGMTASNQAAAALRGSLYGANAGIGVFTGSTIVAGGAAYALAAAMKTTVTAGSDFEKTFSRIATMLDLDKQEAAAEALKDKIVTLGKTSQYTAREVAGAALELSLAGLTVSETMSVLDDVVTLAAVAMFDLEESAQITINTMNAFNIKAEDMGHVVDVMAYASNESSITLKDFANTLKYAGPAAAASGTSVEELAAAIIVLGNAGIRGSSAGTALRRVFVSMSRPTGLASKSLAELNVQMRNADGNAKSMTDVFQDLAKKGATSMDLIRIFGIHAFSAVTVLLRQSGEEAGKAGKSLKGYAEKMETITGLSDKMKVSIEDNVATSFKKLKAVIESIQITAFENMAEGLKNDIDDLTSGLAANASTISQALTAMTSAVTGALLFLARNIKWVLAAAAGFLAWKTYALTVNILTWSIATLGTALGAARKAFVGISLALGFFDGSMRKAAMSVAWFVKIGKGLRFLAGPLSLLLLIGEAVATVAAGLGVLTYGADEATDSVGGLGGAAEKTSEQLLALGRNQMAKEVINATKAYDDASASVKHWQEELRRLAAAKKMAMTDTRGFIDTGRGGRRAIGRAPDLEEAAAITKLQANANLELNLALENQAGRLAYLNKVRNVSLGLAKDATKASEDELQANLKMTQQFDDMTDKLKTQGDTFGMSQVMLDEYTRTTGDMAEIISQTAFALDAEGRKYLEAYTNISNAVELTKKEIAEKKEKGFATEELNAQLETEIKKQNDLHKLLESSYKLQGKTVEGIVAELQARIRAGAVLTDMIPMYEKLTGSMAPLNRELARIDDAMLTMALGTLTAEEAARNFGITVEEVNKALPKMRVDRGLQEVTAALEVAHPALTGMYQATLALNPEIPSFNQYMDDARAKLKLTTLTATEQEEILRLLGLVYEEAAVKAQGFGRSQRALAKQADQATGQLKEDIWLMEYKVKLWGKGVGLIELNDMAWQKYNRTLDELTDTEIALLIRSRDLMDELERIQEVQSVWDDFLDGIDQAFEDVFTGATKNFIQFRDQLIGDFKKMIGKMIYLAVRNSIVLRIRAVYSAAGGTAPGSQFEPTGLVGLDGVGGGVTRTGGFDFMTPVVGALSDFGAGFGEIFGGGYAPASWASAAGYTVGGMAIGGLSGNVVNNLLGGRGSAGQTNVLSAAGGGIGAILGSLGAIGGPIGALIGGAIGGLVSSILGGAKTVTDRGFNLGVRGGNVTGNRYTRIHTSGSFFSGGSSRTVRKELDPAAVEELNATLDAAFGRLTAMAEALGVSTDFFENFTSPSTKISTKGMTEDEIKEALTDWMNGVISSAIEEFITVNTQLADSFRNVVESFRADSEEFIRAFELMAAIAVTANIDPVAKSLEDYTNAQKSATDIYFESVAALTEMTDDFDLSIESLEELGSAYAQNREMAYALAYALRQVKDEITAMFADTSETIRQALMTPDELYAYQDQRVDALVAMLTTLTDPTMIMDTSQEINELVNSMFGSLDEAQQQLLGPEYLTFLDQITALAATQIDEALQTIGDSAQAVDIQIDTTLLDAAAERQMEAANALLAAAEAITARLDAVTENRASGSSGSNNELVIDGRNEVGPITP